MRVSAMIVRAGLAPLNMIARGYQDWACVATDLGDGPVAVWSLVAMDRDRWLLPGMRVTIDVDMPRVGGTTCFAVDPATVPPIRDLVAAGDPVVTDPRGSRSTAHQAYR